MLLKKESNAAALPGFIDVSDSKSDRRVQEFNVLRAVHPSNTETLPGRRNHDGSLAKALMLQLGVPRIEGKPRQSSPGTCHEVPYLEKGEVSSKIASPRFVYPLLYLS
jgi:hypothetical protein